MNYPIKAIETRYKGYRFRSRLEARWAVFFDALGIEWQYEPEGYELPSGRYLPDFYLPTVREGLWVEIKPEPPTLLEQAKIRELSEATGTAVTFRVWEPIKNIELNDFDVNFIFHDARDFWDGGFQFCVCWECGKVGFEFEGRGDRVCGHGGHDDSGHGHPRVLSAALAARGARFEHGAQP